MIYGVSTKNGEYVLQRELMLKKNGIVFFKSNSNKNILEVARELGDVFHIITMPLVQTLTPRLKEKEPENTYSGNFGLKEFPMHTDLAHWYQPPRYFLLRSAKSIQGVSTKIIDSKAILKELESYDISRSHFIPRKRLDRKSYLLKLYHDGIFRWDSLFIIPANKMGISLQKRVEAIIYGIEPNELFLENNGDCLLIDNWRMLHGRSAIPETAMNRKIERVYMNEVNFECK